MTRKYPGILLSVNGRSSLEVVAFVCATLLLIPLSLHFWVATAGLVALVRSARVGNHGPALEPGAALSGSASVPTALVMPIYNEDPRRVFAGIQAMLESLVKGHHLSRS